MKRTTGLSGVGTMIPAPISRQAASWLSALLAIVAVQPAIAQDATAPEVVVDPPGRVARLSYVEGQVSLAPAESEQWAEAVLNRPLTSGDKLWVESDARAELEVGSATLHLDRGTAFGFVQLDDEVMQMSLTEGAATIRVRTLAERESIQVETPNATVFLRHPGEYHFEIDTSGDRTIVKARSGEAEVSGGSKSYVVRTNEEGIFTGLDDLRAQIHPIAPRTPFETWANDRDQREELSVSSRYVSREVIGYEDLDDHGEWLHEPAYGYVWRPRFVAYDWAPYRYGRWAWIRPWGWTWVDDARWGFAPFHYGRWAHLRNRWCWVPGPRHLRPVYAPALVGWVGGPSVSYSASFGRGIGWFPLAPHEVYVPGYRHTPRYIRHVNVSNTIIVNNSQITNIYTGRDRHRDYRYRGHHDAVTVVEHDRFIGGRPIGDQRLRVIDRELREWRDNPRPPAIAPDRESILAGQPRRGGPIGRSHMVGENRSTRDARDVAPGTRPVDRPAMYGQNGNATDRERLEIVRTGNEASDLQRRKREPHEARPARDLIQQSPPTNSPPKGYSPPTYSPPRQSPPAEQPSRREAGETRALYHMERASQPHSTRQEAQRPVKNSQAQQSQAQSHTGAAPASTP